MPDPGVLIFRQILPAYLLQPDLPVSLESPISPAAPASGRSAPGQECRFHDSATQLPRAEGVILAINSGERSETWNVSDGRFVASSPLVTINELPTITGRTIMIPRRSGEIPRLADPA